MKIGIMTLHWGRDNYGQFLQHFALQTALRQMGHEPFLIDYIPTSPGVTFAKRLKLVCLHPFTAIKIVLNKFVEKYFFKQAKSRRREEFERFHKEHFALSECHYSSIEDLQKYPPDADVYITGSDQVWNSFGNINTLSPFFLDFGAKNIRRVAFAASWGRTDLPEKEKEIVLPLLKNFSAVTVREKSGIALCEQFGVRIAELAPDPTLLLSADEYRLMMKRPTNMVGTEKYILLYRLRNFDNFDYSKIFTFARKKKLQVKYITGNKLCDIRKQEFCSVEEWLYLLENAEYLITNSFHGTLFAILFHKKFATIPLTGKVRCMNHRIDTLFEMAEMKPRYLDDFSVLDTPYFVKSEKLHRNATKILEKILQQQ